MSQQQSRENFRNVTTLFLKTIYIFREVNNSIAWNPQTRDNIDWAIRCECR